MPLPSKFSHVMMREFRVVMGASRILDPSGQALHQEK